MTPALEQAFKLAAELSQEQQDSLAAFILIMEEIASEDQWQRLFAQSQDALSKLAAEALNEDLRGRTVEME